jgi:hypothetical protein
LDEDGSFEDASSPPSRCPDDCPNVNTPYCPMHEDPAIYRRDEGKLHLQEAYAHNAAREMIFAAIETLRKRRSRKEIRVPVRQMDEWLVFTRQVVLDSGEHTAQGEIERRIGEWLDRTRDQDWAALDRLKERYMRFTPDYKGERPVEDHAAEQRAGLRPKTSRTEAPVRRPAKRKTGPADVDAEYYEEDF